MVVIRTWGREGHILSLPILLVEEKSLVSSTLLCGRDCLCLGEHFDDPGKDGGTRDAFRRKGGDPVSYRWEGPVRLPGGRETLREGTLNGNFGECGPFNAKLLCIA